MNTFRITFEDGNTITTGFNGSLSDALAYYIGKAFNFGDTDSHPADRMVKAISVVEL